MGIGASAGSLEVLERLFAALPGESGFSFIVVQHLERNHPSMLADLLARHTQMPVQQVVNGVRPAPNHVYIIPPDAVLTIKQGRLKIDRPKEAGLRLPIDAFFGSLAEDQGENAVGVVLSGAGSDGTAGLRAIKANGGLTLAQDPETAKYDSMPQNAIAGGGVDFVLPVEEIPARVREYAERRTEIGGQGDEVYNQQITARLGAICAILEQHTGHDFSRYKQSTLLRRIRRRVQLRPGGSVDAYVHYLQTHTSEVDLLHRDLLIGVTHFFRDPEVFEALEDRVLPEVLEHGDTHGTIRIWVPGCASGEEVYSIAMLLREHLSRIGSERPTQIFGTDLGAEMLAKARQGIYPDEIRERISPERLERFFVPDGRSYQVTKALREMCTFSEHSLINDPPFSSLDLISCRNVLIYLGVELQKKLVPLFHFALRPRGVLVLGPSESLASKPELFITLDKKHRIYQRNDAVARPTLELPLPGRVSRPQDAPLPAAGPAGPPLFGQAFERMVLEEYAPPCAVVNERGDILYVAGRMGRYLHPAAGVPTNNLIDMAQGGLRVAIREALARAVRNRRRVVRDNLTVEGDRGFHQLRLTLRPLPGVHAESGLYAAVLQNMGVDEDESAVDQEAVTPEQPIIEQLENELRTTRSDLQSALEDLESTNEELKSANEELTSTNEELQSVNEELHSSAEELQSSNDELHSKMEELDEAHSDLQHHYAGTSIATVFLDRDLRITKFTPAVRNLFNVLDGDVGRPIRDLAPRFVGEELLGDVEAVLTSGGSRERRVRQAEGSTWFLVRILPYCAHGDVITGVGITFVDITDLERAEEAERRYGHLLRLSLDSICVWGLHGGIESWNRGAEELYGYAFEEVKGKRPEEALGERFPCPRPVIDAALRESGRWEGEVQARTKDGREVVLLAKLLLMQGDDGVDRVLQSDRDVTERKKLEESLRKSHAELNRAQEMSHTGSWRLDVPQNRWSWSDELHRMLGRPKETPPSREAFQAAVHPDDRELVDQNWKAVLCGQRYDIEHRLLIGDHVRWIRQKGEVVCGEDGTAAEFLGTAHDITDLKERAIERDRLIQMLGESDQRKSEFLAILSHELRNPLTPITNGLHLLERAVPGGEEARRAQEILTRQVRQLTRLVDDLLDITRITRSKLELQRQRLELNELVRRTLDDYRAVFESGEVQVEFEPAPAPIFVMGDWNRLAQVIGNLLQNAAKFTGRGGSARVSVSSDVGRQQAVVVVTDTGMGITPEVLSHVFQPFMQAETTLDRSKGGLGLGLALVKSLVEMHGGEVTAHSFGLGRGADFVVRLPLERAVRHKAGPSKGARRHNGRRVLVVEDNADAAESLRLVLQAFGHEVEVAHNGPEGIAKATALRPDVVLCDIGLPGVNGYEVARALRANEELEGVHLVALSGYALPEDLERAQRAGFEKHLAKPPDLEKLEELLANLPSQDGAE